MERMEYNWIGEEEKIIFKFLSNEWMRTESRVD